MTLSYIPADTNAEGILKAAASGTLPNGKPVVVNTDGTVSVVAASGVAGGSILNTTVFNNAATDSISAVFDSNSNKIVIAYRDKGNSSHGTAIVGTIANSAITFGSEVVFESAAVNYVSASFDSSNNKVVIVYRDEGNSNYGTAIVGTVSGTGISFGSAATFNSGTTVYSVSTFDSNSNKVVIFYRDGGNSNYGTAIVGTVSGTSISFGSEVVFSTAQTDHIKCSFDSNANKVVVIYEIGNASGRAKVGTVSGTGISFGTEATFVSNNTNSMAISFDTTANKFAIFYRDVGNSNDGRCRVATISGTDITFGTEVVFYTDDSVNNLNSIYNPDNNKTSVVYTDGDGGVGTLQNGTISGTTISFDAQLRIRDGGSNDYGLSFGLAYDTNSNLTCISYGSAVSAEIGTASLYEPFSTNLTSENYIGMSSGVVDVNSVAQTAGSSTVFEAANSAYISATFDSNSNKVVIAFRDDGDSGKGKAIVGTVSGTSISFGSAAVFYSGFSNYIVASFDSSNNKVVIAYRDDNNSDYGTAIVGTVSGTNISFGSATVFESARSDHITSTFNSTSGKIVIAYTDKGNSSILTAIVGTVSGTSISFGTAVAVTGNPQGYYNSITSESASSKIVIGYTNGSNSDYGTAVVGTVSNTSISFGTPVVFESATATFSSATFDSTSGKVVIAYTDEGNSSYGTAIVGTVSSTSISFGSATVFESGSSSEFSASFDPLSNSVVVAYRDNGNSNYITFAIGSVSGSSVSFSSPVVFDTAGSEYISSVAYGNEAKVVIAYKDAGNSNYGTAGVIQPAYTYITRGEVPSGSQAITDIIGSVSSIQTGLTAGQSYFVQTDGTIGLTADDPSVFAGTAISATKLIVKT